MEKQGVIYKIENLVNGKVYIGQTRVGYKKRTNEHLYSLRKNIHNNDYLQRAWNKYGEESFSFSIVETCDINELDDKETNWISHFRNSVGSYNLESGGNKNKTHCDESRKKMSKASRETWRNPEYAIKMKKIMGEIHGGKNNVNAKKVICINTNEIFETMTEAAIKFNLGLNDVFKVCSGERISAGFHKIEVPLQFSYYEEGKTYKLKTLKNLREKRRIICTNTKELFDSTGSAAKKYGLSQGSIVKCCKGKIKSAGKLPNGEYSVWVYEEDYDPNKNYFFHRNKGENSPNAKKVICVNTGQVFISTREAAEKMNVQQSKISLCCNGKRKTTGKLPDGTPLEWRFYE